MSRLICPHRLRATSAGIRFRVRADRLRSIGVIDLDYGNRVRIDSNATRDFYLVQIPWHGHARIAQGRQEIASTARLASVISPDEPISMVWGQGNPHLIFFAERKAMEQELKTLTGRPLSQPLQFALGMPVHRPAQQAWIRALHHLREEIRLGSPMVTHPVTLAQLEHTLLTGLLLSQPHNYSSLLPPQGSPVAAVRRATAYMEQHIGQPLALTEVATAIGCGVRALQKGFRSELDTTPMSWLRQRRMELAQERLQMADPSTTTVTEIAQGLGITHMGRFAVEYRDRFGESPSQTLQDTTTSSVHGQPHRTTPVAG